MSENLSSNTFFHFTNSRENLEGILEYSFKPRYCLEQLDYLSNSLINNLEMAYPMVCFCDIPLSKIKKHIKEYGGYGIGLKKEWGFKKGLTPVIYSDKRARTSKNIESIINWSKKYLKEGYDEGNDKDNELKKIFNDFIMLTKPYYGESKETRFYDEREWRWIPDISPDSDVLMHLEKQYYLKEEYRRKHNKKIGECYKLEFTPEDISFLIVEEEKEVYDLIEKIESLNANYNDQEIKRLLTKIITTEQILKDF